MAPRKKRYELTEKHRAEMAPWAQRWIANAMSTAPMTPADREAVQGAIRGLYESANLQPPPADSVVFVPSPFVARFAGGFAAAIWYLRRQHQISGLDATRAATRAATMDATWAATRAATMAATWDATRDATRDATWAATGDAVDEATAPSLGSTPPLDKWFTGISSEGMRAVAAAFVPEAADLLLSCAHSADYMWNGGNQYSGDVAWLSFFRHVAQLPLDYSKWQHYETVCIHSGPRIMHAKFCIVSERPFRLLVDDQNRPHCDDGPFCAWRDGTALWAVHGVRVPAWVVTNPERITVQHVQQEKNAELRRVLLERYGHERFIKDSGAVPVHADAYGTLYRTEFEGDEPLVVVRVKNSTPEPDGESKFYTIRVPPDTTTAHGAVAWSFGLTPKTYHPVVET